MIQIGLIGLGAGAASALLFASVASGSPLAFLLANFAQLPIMIGAIGWTHYAGIVAVFFACAGLFLFTGSTVTIAFLLGIGLPAWWIGYLALLARPGADSGSVEWYPVGRIVVWTAIAAALVIAVTMLRYGIDATQIEAGIRRELERALRFLSGASASGPLALPGVKDPDRLIDILVLIVPPLKATALTATSLLNLWLAALIVRVSGRLKRPWPPIAQMTFPSFTPMVLVVAVGGTFLPGAVGIVSGVFSASLLLAYALLGFAVLHAVTVGLNGRSFLITGVYFTVGLFGWPAVVMSMLGLAETMLAIRARFARKRPPPAPPGSITRR